MVESLLSHFSHPCVTDAPLYLFLQVIPCPLVLSLLSITDAAILRLQFGHLIKHNNTARQHGSSIFLHIPARRCLSRPTLLCSPSSILLLCRSRKNVSPVQWSDMVNTYVRSILVTYASNTSQIPESHTSLQICQGWSTKKFLSMFCRSRRSLCYCGSIHLVGYRRVSLDAAVQRFNARVRQRKFAAHLEVGD